MWIWSGIINFYMYNKKSMKNKFEILKKIIKKTTNKNIDVNKTFLENNLDSLDVMSIAMEIEKQFSVKIFDNKIKKMKKPKDFLNFVK